MNIDLKSREWKAFTIGSLFDVSGTVTTHPSRLVKDGKIPRITCAASNNGVDGVYKNPATEEAGVLTVDSATVGFVSYQECSFIATDHVEKISLRKNLKMSRCLGLFLKTCIESSISGKYGYGYKFSQTRIKRQKILLPVTEQGEPDYDFMERYVNSVEKVKLEKYISYIKLKISPPPPPPPDFRNKTWVAFVLDDVFFIKPGKRLVKMDMLQGRMPFVGASDSDNGITGFVANKNESVDSNVLGVNYNGSVVNNFYHPYEAIFSDDVKRLSFKSINANKYTYLFAKIVIMKQKNKYDYGYKFNEERMKKQKIFFPVNAGGDLDCAYMGWVTKFIECKKLEKYFSYIDRKYK